MSVPGVVIGWGVEVWDIEGCEVVHNYQIYGYLDGPVWSRVIVGWSHVRGAIGVVEVDDHRIKYLRLQIYGGGEDVY